jgi:hypothetical protein
VRGHAPIVAVLLAQEAKADESIPDPKGRESRTPTDFPLHNIRVLGAEGRGHHRLAGPLWQADARWVGESPCPRCGSTCARGESRLASLDQRFFRLRAGRAHRRRTLLARRDPRDDHRIRLDCSRGNSGDELGEGRVQSTDRRSEAATRRGRLLARAGLGHANQPASNIVVWEPCDARLARRQARLGASAVLTK